jgi:hypothetical protein
LINVTRKRVIEMAPSFLGTEFNKFLFASISEDRNERQLSVVSVLARMNLDPWLEAAQLSQSPRDIAARRLADLIAALPDGASAHAQPGANALRLIALLPSRDAVAIPASATLLDVVVAPQYRGVIVLMMVVLVMGVLFFAAGGHVPDPGPAAQDQPATVIAPPVPPPSYGER